MAKEIKDITQMSEEELREEHTLEKLKNMVSNLELVSDVDQFKTKGQLIDIVRLAGRKRPTSGPGQAEKDQKRYEAKKEEMREILDEQEDVNVFISLEGKEKKGRIVEKVNEETGKVEEIRVGAWLPVTINGLQTWIPKGVSTKVPLQVAELVGQYQSDTSEALAKYVIEGDVPDALKE